MYHRFVIPLREKQTTKEKQTNKQTKILLQLHPSVQQHAEIALPSHPVQLELKPGTWSALNLSDGVCSLRFFFFLFVVVAFMASAVSMHLRETKGDGIEDNTHTHKAARIGP